MENGITTSPISQRPWSELLTLPLGCPIPSAKSKTYKHVNDVIKVYEILTQKYGIAEPMELLRLAELKLWPGRGDGLNQRQRPAQEAQEPIEQRRQAALKELYKIRPRKHRIEIQDTDSSRDTIYEVDTNSKMSSAASSPLQPIIRRTTTKGPVGRRSMAESLKKARKRLTKVESNIAISRESNRRQTIAYRYNTRFDRAYSEIDGGEDHRTSAKASRECISTFSKGRFLIWLCLFLCVIACLAYVYIEAEINYIYPV